jgi:hypothetical protein
MDFEPLIKNISMFTTENFVDNAQTRSLTETVLIGISLMVLATIIIFAFLSAYGKSKYLFIVVYSVLVLIYLIVMLILILSKKNVLTPLQYEMYMGSTLAMAIIAIIFVGFFSYKHRSGMAPSNAPAYSFQSQPQAPAPSAFGN